jgi:alanyl-tRNA synthetase
VRIDSCYNLNGQASVSRDVFPPTPPGPEGSNGNGLFRVQWAAGAWLFSLRRQAPMTNRLYYTDPQLHEFDSVIEEVVPVTERESRSGVILRETAFYPTSGGQVYDTGWLTVGVDNRLRVSEVADTEDGRIVHYLEVPPRLSAGDPVRGTIDPERRRDHMQQHSGQHVLSAAFIELYQIPTVSFHMGDDYCSIDLTTPSLTAEQIAGAERRANEIVFENRPVTIRFVSRAEAEKLGLRKLSPADRDELRLIEVADFDLSACGGTHVSATGQIGSILLRKSETVRQGMRVEFVCGIRAVRTVRRDYTALSDSAKLFSTQLWDVPEQIRKTFDDAKTLRKQRDDTLDELGGAMATTALNQQTETHGTKIVVRTFDDRDIAFAKLFAQKVARSGVPAIALVASTIDPAGLVFAQSAGGKSDMGALLKQILATVGGRGGGTRDFAQGGVPAGSDLQRLLNEAAGKIAT